MFVRIIIALFIVLVSGCGNKDEPEFIYPAVNVENCRHENVVKLPEKHAIEFKSRCVRQSNFRKSEEKGW